MKAIFFSIFLFPIFLFSQTYDYTVATDGSGDFTTLQAAIDACPNNVRKTIFVKAGTYQEKIMIGSHTQTSAKLLNIIGENAETTIITWDDYNGKSINYGGSTVTSGTPQSATFTVNATDFYAENLTIQNTYTTKQAVALYNVADRQTFKNCRIIGYQDTHYLKKGRRSYFYQCYIEGGTDYICAGGTALFEECTLKSVKNGSYITAPEDIVSVKQVGSKKYYYGFVFLNCNLISDAGIEVYLGRPWQPTSSSVYLECTMQNIKAAGWSIWSGNNHTTSFFAEYKSKNPDGSLVDTTQRISWSYQLSDAEVQNYYKREDVFSAGGYYTAPYDPFTLTGNPTSVVVPEVDKKEIVKIEVYTLTGHKIAENKNVTTIPNTFSDVLQQGIYFLKIYDKSGKSAVKKILVK
jgi:pectin methylesterase-like acyl-CoA thioesterase